MKIVAYLPKSRANRVEGLIPGKPATISDENFLVARKMLHGEIVNLTPRTIATAVRLRLLHK